MRGAAILMGNWLHKGGIYHVIQYVEGKGRQVLHGQRGKLQTGKGKKLQ